ncbi:MAG: glucokinase [Cognatishimia sp.]|nr:glucokinase [Cognatishimia sp.]
MSSSRMFLVADIGGTNTRVGLADENGLIEGTTERYRNAESGSFHEVVDAYMSQAKPGRLSGACAGAAGLVADGVAQMTNLDWKVDRDVIAEVTGAPAVDVINDLQAQGYALDELPTESLKSLIAGDANKVGPRLVIGLGTGFNIVPVHKDLDRLIVPSCEAGHMTAPYRSDLSDIYAKIEAKCGGVRIEWLLAGQGLQNIYEAHAGQRVPAGDVMQLVSKGDTTALSALTDYMTVLGAVTGDLAIAHLPYGGIFFTGGVSRAVAPYFDSLGFAEKMVDKGEFKPLLSGFPVTLIDDDFAALKGCARYLKQISV